MDQLIIHDTQAVCGWPISARSELFAVARRDIAVARRNLTSLTRYVDMHDAHLAVCDWWTGRPYSTDDRRDVPPCYWGDTVSARRGRPAEVVPPTDDGDAVTPTGSLDFFGPGRKLGQYVCLPGPLLY